jgi:hypothetical protein
MLFRANKLRAEVQLPNMQADDSWLHYFESAFEKAAKVCCVSSCCAVLQLFFAIISHSLQVQTSEMVAKVDQIHEELS